jgi:hypothetical protein
MKAWGISWFSLRKPYRVWLTLGIGEHIQSKRGQDKSALSLSSRNCFGSTSEGAWVIRQVAF